MSRTKEEIRTTRAKILNYITRHPGRALADIAAGIRTPSQAIYRDLEYLTTHLHALRKDEQHRYYIPAADTCLLASVLTPALPPELLAIKSRKVVFPDEWKADGYRPNHLSIGSSMNADYALYL